MICLQTKPPLSKLDTLITAVFNTTNLLLHITKRTAFYAVLYCATGTKKMTLNSPDFAAYEISFKIT